MFYFQNGLLIVLMVFLIARFLRCSLLQSAAVALFFGVCATVSVRTTAAQTESRFWQGMDSLLAQPYGKLTGHLVNSVRESRSDVDLVRIFEEVQANAFLIQSVWKYGRNLDPPPESASYEHFVHNLVCRRPVPGLTDDNRRVKLRARDSPETNKDIATMTNCEYLSTDFFKPPHPAGNRLP